MEPSGRNMQFAADSEDLRGSVEVQVLPQVSCSLALQQPEAGVGGLQGGLQEAGVALPVPDGGEGLGAVGAGQVRPATVTGSQGDSGHYWRLLLLPSHVEDGHPVASRGQVQDPLALDRRGLASARLGGPLVVGPRPLGAERLAADAAEEAGLVGRGRCWRERRAGRERAELPLLDFWRWLQLLSSHQGECTSTQQEWPLSSTLLKTVGNVQCPVCSVQSAVCSVQCAV